MAIIPEWILFWDWEDVNPVWFVVKDRRLQVFLTGAGVVAGCGDVEYVTLFVHFWTDAVANGQATMKAVLKDHHIVSSSVSPGYLDSDVIGMGPEVTLNIQTNSVQFDPYYFRF